MFLSVIGPSNIQAAEEFRTPEKPGDKSYKDLVKKNRLIILSDSVRDHATLQVPWQGRFRLTGESIAAYVAELQALAEFCNFGAMLEDMLRDQLVWGIKMIRCNSVYSKSRS